MRLYQNMRSSTSFGTRTLWCFALVALIFAYFTVNQNADSNEPPSSDILPRSFPVTYRDDEAWNAPLKTFYVRVPGPAVAGSPLITAVILNWSRLPNVVRIVSLLCSPSLNDKISSISLWNNSPRKLSGKVSGNPFYLFAR
jgi:hypothetical protein